MELLSTQDDVLADARYELRSLELRNAELTAMVAELERAQGTARVDIARVAEENNALCAQLAVAREELETIKEAWANGGGFQLVAALTPQKP